LEPLHFSPFLINLPQLTACITATSIQQHEILAADLDVAAQANVNLPDAQMTLLMFHGQYGHVRFSRMVHWHVFPPNKILTRTHIFIILASNRTILQSQPFDSAVNQTQHIYTIHQGTYETTCHLAD
jgi:hypothetical protein